MTDKQIIKAATKLYGKPIHCLSHNYFIDEVGKLKREYYYLHPSGETCCSAATPEELLSEFKRKYC